MKEKTCQSNSRVAAIKYNKDKKVLRRNPIEDGAISGFSGQKSVPE